MDIDKKPIIDDINSLPFQIPVTVYTGSSTEKYQALWADTLDGGIPDSPVVVLNEYDGPHGSEPGLYYKTGSAWELAIQYNYLPDYIINGGTVAVYYNINSSRSAYNNSLVFKDGKQQTSGDIPASDTHVWADLYITPLRNNGTARININTAVNGVYTISDEEARYQNLILNGSLSNAGNYIIIFPDDNQSYTIVNNIIGDVTEYSKVYMMTQSQYNINNTPSFLTIFITQQQSLSVTVFKDVLNAQKIIVSGTDYLNEVYTVDLTKDIPYIYSLYAGNSGCATLRLTGQLSEDSKVILPHPGKWTIINDCSGGKTVRIVSQNNKGGVTLEDGQKADVVHLASINDQPANVYFITTPVNPSLRKAKYLSYSGDINVDEFIEDIADGDIFALGGGTSESGLNYHVNLTLNSSSNDMLTLVDGARFIVNNQHKSGWGNVYFIFSPSDSVDVMFNKKLGGDNNKVYIPGQTTVTFQWSDGKWLCWALQ
ncbi:hypothetical protein ACEZI6_004719 [Escherichia coli]